MSKMDAFDKFAIAAISTFCGAMLAGSTFVIKAALGEKKAKQK